MYTTAAVVAFALFAAITSFVVPPPSPLLKAQQQVPPPLVPPPLDLKPGAVELSPSQAAAIGVHGPSQAQIQADIASHQADVQKDHAILDELSNAIGKDASHGHVAAVLKDMQAKYPDKVHCPGFVAAKCYIESRAQGVPPNISPPVAP